MFRVSQHPSSGVLKTVSATSGISHDTGTATSFQRGLIRTPVQFGSVDAATLPNYPHRCILIDILTKVSLARSNSALPDDGDYTETCWSCFNPLNPN